MKYALYVAGEGLLRGNDMASGTKEPSAKYIPGRFTKERWEPRSFPGEGFSVGKGDFIFRQPVTSVLSATWPSLVLIAVMKGHMEYINPLGKSTWIAEAGYVLSHWKAEERQQLRFQDREQRLVIFEMSRRFLDTLFPQGLQVLERGRYLDLRQIEDDFRLTGPINYLMHQALFHLLHGKWAPPLLGGPECIRLEKLLREILGQFARKSDPGIEELIRYINAHLDLPLDIESLSVRAMMGESLLRKKFKHMTGTSLKSYVLNRKMEKAMELVTGSGMSISQIAAEVGYLSLISFERMFRSRFGHTPSFFRSHHPPGPGRLKS